MTTLFMQISPQVPSPPADDETGAWIPRNRDARESADIPSVACPQRQ
jgi:hypothetical protein